MAQAGRPATASEWHDGWTLVAAAMVGYSLSSIPAGSTGVMMELIERDFGWSRTEIYSGTALISFIGVGLATFMGAAIDRLGPRRIAIAAALLMCGSVAMLSTVGNSLWQWWAAWAVVGIAAATMPTVWLAPVASRFNASRGLAVAIVLSGSGMATFLVPIVTHALTEQYGWRGGYIGLGAIWAVFTLPFILLFFRGPRRPQGGGQSVPSAEERAKLPGLTVREGFSSPTYYKLLFAAFGSIFGGVAIIMNLVPMLVSTGLERGTAAPIAGLIGIATITGRVFGGWLMDRMSAKVIAAISTFVASILPVTLLVAPGSAGAATFGVIAYGVVGGAKVGALAYLASRHLGQRAFGTLYGSINAVVALAVGISPLAANYIYDLTQSYEIVLWAAVPVLTVAALLYLSLGPYPDFSDRGETSARE
ncbi:MAG: MFS transporter [Novosphingobium sp.]|nr:MFS transporter [Novosphingobium sp.]MCP5401003.1 MFS transporter [Novosphingobium sp.]